jgi:hypothetical protein
MVAAPIAVTESTLEPGAPVVLVPTSVVLDGSEFGGISLIGRGAWNVFADNRVEGSAACALGLVADFFEPQALATRNVFVGNQVSQFVPRDSAYYGTGAHVFFDAHTRARTS